MIEMLQGLSSMPSAGGGFSWSAGRDMNAVNVPSSATSSAKAGDFLDSKKIEIGGMQFGGGTAGSLVSIVAPFLAAAFIGWLFKK